MTFQMDIINLLWIHFSFVLSLLGAFLMDFFESRLELASAKLLRGESTTTHSPTPHKKRLCIYFLSLWLFVVISTYWQSTVIACYIILRCPRHLANMFNFIVIDESPFVAVSTSPPVLSLQIFANSPSSYNLHPKAFLPSPASHWLTPKLRKYQAQWNCLCSKTTHLFLFSPVEQHSSNHQYKIRIVFDCTPDKRIGWKKKHKLKWLYLISRPPLGQTGQTGFRPICLHGLIPPLLVVHTHISDWLASPKML